MNFQESIVWNWINNDEHLYFTIRDIILSGGDDADICDLFEEQLNPLTIVDVYYELLNSAFTEIDWETIFDSFKDCMDKEELASIPGQEEE
ncbi:MAG: hypothetical protein ABFS03_03995 [Chloroflexota bacterium]